MPKRPPMFRPPGWRPRPVAEREYEARRKSASDRGYGHAWAKARAGHLKRSPLCRYCEVGAFGDPRIAPATLVDHFYPHGGDRDIFWASEWWVSCCADCHNGPKQALERCGRAALDALAPRLDLPVMTGRGVKSLLPLAS